MSAERNSRAGFLAAKSRARRVEIKGPPERRSARTTEEERIERGRRTLSSAYGGVPNRADFIREADLFETSEGSKRIDRAFIISDKANRLQGRVVLFWYRRDTKVEVPCMFRKIMARDKDGVRYELEPLEDAAQEWKVRLKSVSYARKCTGIATFFVRELDK
jgi:hypothetical protein